MLIMGSKFQKYGNWTYIVIALLIVISLGCLVVQAYIHKIYHNMLLKELRLVPGTILYENWQNPNIPLFVTFNFFDLQNTQDVYNGAQPIFHEIGPFTYKGNFELQNISFPSTNRLHSIKFDVKSVYHFVPHLSVSNPENVSFTTLNILITAMNNHLANTRENEGYYHPVVTYIGNIFLSMFNGFAKYSIHDYLWGDAVAVMHDKNNSVMQNIIFGTGVDNIENLGKVLSIEGETAFKAWDNEYANMYNGTVGIFFGQKLEVGSHAYMLLQLLCRSILLNVTGIVDHPDLPEYKVLKLVPSLADGVNNDAYPPLTAFQHSNEKDILRGMLSMSNCLQVKDNGYLPAFASYPHFLNVPVSDQTSFVGVRSADQEVDNSYVLVDSKLGVPISMKLQVQANFHYYTSYPSFGKMPRPIYFPLFYLTVTTNTDKESLSKFYFYVHELERYIRLALIIIGSILTHVAFGLIAYFVIVPQVQKKCKK